LLFGIGRSGGGRSASTIRWWWPVFGLSTPAGATPMPRRPNQTLNGLFTVSPLFGQPM
jgi:hypothetical protein